MDEALPWIVKRRSIRRFRNSKPDASTLSKMLEAGRWAPSGLNNQPWRFHLVDSKKTKDDLSHLTKYSSIIRQAGALIVVGMDLDSSYNRDKDLMAIGACIQNILLEASTIGWGACWLGEILNRKEEVRKLLQFDSRIEIMAVLAIGKPIHSPKGPSRLPVNKLMIQQPPDQR